MTEVGGVAIVVNGGLEVGEDAIVVRVGVGATLVLDIDVSHEVTTVSVPIFSGNVVVEDGKATLEVLGIDDD